MRLLRLVSWSTLALFVLISGNALGQYKMDDKRPYGPGDTEGLGVPGDGVPVPDSLGMGDEGGLGDEDLMAEDFYVDTSDTLASAPMSIAPNMIGDFIGGSLLGSLPMAGGDRRFKITEDFNPFPRDRVFFNYHHFSNAVSNLNHELDDLDRFLFGFEKTFFNERTSAEVRIPFVNGLNDTQTAGTTTKGTEFSDISLTLKAILYERCYSVVSGGVSITFPTGPDGTLVGGRGGVTTVSNESVLVAPFLAYMTTPTDRSFVQASTQFVFDTNGYGVSGVLGNGRLQTQTLMFADVSGGYWLYRNPCASYIKGMAGLVELHYTTTLNDADAVGVLGNRYNRLDFLNLTGGLHFQIGQKSTLRVAGGAPLKSTGPDHPYDAEFVLQYNRMF